MADIGRWHKRWNWNTMVFVSSAGLKTEVCENGLSLYVKSKSCEQEGKNSAAVCHCCHLSRCKFPCAVYGKWALIESWQSQAFRLCLEVISRYGWLTLETEHFMLLWACFLSCFWQWKELGIKPSFPAPCPSSNAWRASINNTVLFFGTHETAPKWDFTCHCSFPVRAVCCC